MGSTTPPPAKGKKRKSFPFQKNRPPRSRSPRTSPENPPPSPLLKLPKPCPPRGKKNKEKGPDHPPLFRGKFRKKFLKKMKIFLKERKKSDPKKPRFKEIGKRKKTSRTLQLGPPPWPRPPPRPFPPHSREKKGPPPPPPPSKKSPPAIPPHPPPPRPKKTPHSH